MTRLRPRARWVLFVTVAEALGFAVPVVVGVVLRTMWEGANLVPLLILAGLVEGTLLGLGQAGAMPIEINRRRFVLFSALGAGVAWFCALAVVQLFEKSTLPIDAQIGIAVSMGLVALFSIGAAQWLELRHRMKSAHHWIAWSGLAWTLALPLSFAPSPLVDEFTPPWLHLLLWTAAGTFMALVMANVTWFGIRRAIPRARFDALTRQKPLSMTRYWGHNDSIGNWS